MNMRMYDFGIEDHEDERKVVFTSDYGDEILISVSYDQLSTIVSMLNKIIEDHNV